jgi:murein DD-endopeptidase MepM/ murein hydrolase activator NlpD
MTAYIEPFDAKLRGDEFGNLAAYRKGRPHRGQDWHPKEGSTIPAITAGTVMAIFYSQGLGYCLIQSTFDGYFVLYAHMESHEHKVGDKLDMGSTVGKVGNTGTLTTGPHLHLSMATSKNVAECLYDKLIDPLKHIQANLAKPIPAKPPVKRTKK